MKTTLFSSSPAVTLLEAKAHLRILHDDEDASIQLCLDTATAIAEQRTNRVLSAFTFDLSMQKFETVVLEKTPFVSIVSIEYENELGEMSAYTDFEYITDIYYDRCKIVFNSVQLDYKNNGKIIIRYEAGYDPTPAPIKSFILIHLATLFENREMLVVGASVSDAPKNFYFDLLNSYRIVPV